MNAMRQAVVVSRMREGSRLMVNASRSSELIEPPVGQGDTLSIDWKESLYLATEGGAVALGLPGFGGFSIGTPFDAQYSKWIQFSSRHI